MIALTAAERQVLEAIRTYATSFNSQLAHLASAALGGDADAAQRILFAIQTIDTVRPDAAVSRSLLTA